MRLLIFLTAILFLSALQFPVYEDNARLDNYLQKQINMTKGNTLIPAYMVMQKQLSLAEVQRQTAHLQKKERRKAVVRLLKEHAAAEQKAILAFLEKAQSDGAVDDIRILWAVNVIAFNARPAVFNMLQNQFQNFQKIRYDATYPAEYSRDQQPVLKENPGKVLALQPGLSLINVPQVWAEGDSGQGIVVANIDHGTDWDHPDLVKNIWQNPGEDFDGDGHTIEYIDSEWVFDPGDINNMDDDGNGYADDFIGWDFTNNDNDPFKSDDSHGTQTAGIVAGDGSNGTQTGVAPRAKLLNLQIDQPTQTEYWEAYQYAIEKGVDVITSSTSYKWYFSPQPDYPMFRQMTDMELAAGIVHTNSTSNDGGNLGNAPVPYNIAAPGNSPSPWIHPAQPFGGVSSVIGVGNVNVSTDAIVSGSPYGPVAWEDIKASHPDYPFVMPEAYRDYPFETVAGAPGLVKPDVAAPGEGTQSTINGEGYGGFSGTSSATAHTAGTIALLLSANPDLEPADISRILQTTAVPKGDPGKDNRYGAGRIDAYQAWLKATAEITNPYSPRPSKPLQFSAYSDYRNPNSIRLSWLKPTLYDNGDSLLTSHFKIMITRDDVVIDSVGGDSSSYSDNDLEDGRLYHYAIWAEDRMSGAASPTVQAEWHAGGSPVPGTPALTHISGGRGFISIGWINPVSNTDGTPLDDFAGIRLYRNSLLAAEFIRSTIDTAAVDSLYYEPEQHGYYQWAIAAFDNEDPSNESSWSDPLQTPLQLPFADAFSRAGIPNPVFWQSYDVIVDDRPLNAPSSPYAANLNGTPHNEDSLQLNPVDLSNDEGRGIVFAYAYQPGGQSEEPPESDDSLRVFFRNNSAKWVLVRSHGGSDVVPFEQEIIDIENTPAGGGSFFHDRFQVLFDVRATFHWVLPRDDWFVDNIFLGTPAPAIAVSADSITFDSSYVAGSDTLLLEISNIGLQTLQIKQITIDNPVFSLADYPDEIAAGAAFPLAIFFSAEDQSYQQGLIKIAHNAVNLDTVYITVKTNRIIVGLPRQESIPQTFSVSSNYPNPFNPQTTIHYQLPVPVDVNLSVYNMAGQKIATLVSQHKAAGDHTIIWEGINDLGEQVGSGVYVYVFEAGKFRRVHKMLLLK